MTGLIESISSTYKYLFEELTYPLSRNFPLVGSPLPLIVITITYIYFCTRLGPQFMRNRKPYNLKKYLFVYNLIQVLLNAYMCYEAVKYTSSEQYSFICQNVDDPTTPRARWAVKVGYVFYMVKYLDLLDTVFFVLRKSNRQISTLHLHHHIVMPFGIWVGITYVPGGPGAVVVLLNSFVHSIMYTYYLLAGLGAEYQKMLWWKKYVTILQLIQFSLYAILNFNSIFYDCGFSKVLKILVVVYSLIFFKMFATFYYNAYMVNKTEPELNNKVVNGKQPLNKTM